MLSTVAAEIGRVRRSAGMTQEQFGRAHAMSASAVSMGECGERPVPRDIQREVVMTYGDYRLALVMAEEITGGMSPPALDARRCDLSPAGSGDKTDEEMAEALAARAYIRRLMCNVRGPADVSEQRRVELVAHLGELAEAMTAMANHMDSVCRTAGIDPLAEIWEPLRRHLISAGYLTPDKKGNRPYAGRPS